METQKGRRCFLKYLCSSLAFGAGSIYSIDKNKDLKIGKTFPISVSRSEAQSIGDTVSRMKKITIEEYFTTESLLDYLRSRIKAGAKYDSLFDYNSEQLLSGMLSEKRLKDMDEAGIDMQVISALPWHEGLVDPSEATAMARRTNDETHEIIKKYPKRYAGFAGLAFQDPEAASKELERAVKDLGLKGAMIYSHIHGKFLDDKKFWPVFEKAENLNVPIYLHPKGPPPNMIEPYLDYGLWGPALGFGADISVHALRLIGSGLFDKYPGLKIILGHAGEGLPYWLHRLGMGVAQAQTGASAPIQPGARIPRMLGKKKPGQYILDNFYVTPTGMFWEPVLMFMHSVLGPDRIIFAVDYPAGSNVEGVKSIEALPISNADKEKIFHLNAVKLLKL
jgi:5-carboxyvanillate decarboxylase